MSISTTKKKKQFVTCNMQEKKVLGIKDGFFKILATFIVSIFNSGMSSKTKEILLSSKLKIPNNPIHILRKQLPLRNTFLLFFSPLWHTAFP